MALWIDTGHGFGNRKPGVNDPGAVGNGAKEAEVVREIAAAALPLLQASGVDVRMAPDGNITTVRIPWQRKTLTKSDTFIALHMDSAGSSTATGCTVFYPSDKTYLRIDAELLVTAYATGTGLRNRGAKPDSATAVGRVGVLHASEAAAFLIELGYMGNKGDIEAVRSNGAQALTTAILTILDMPPVHTPSPEQARAFAAMIALGIYTSGTPKTQDRYEQAVLFSRLLDATDRRYVRA